MLSSNSIAAANSTSRPSSRWSAARAPRSTQVTTRSSGSSAVGMGKASTAASKRLHAYVSGRVQGVFFRHYTQDKALLLGLTGWVRNRRDGRVEVMAEGLEEDLQQLLTWLHTGSPQADVTGVTSSWAAASGEFDGFETLWTV